MQKIATALGAPTTGFVIEEAAHKRYYACRFFTPKKEIDMCGHVSIALATALTRKWHLGNPVHKLTQRCQNGEIELRLRQHKRKRTVTLFQEIADVKMLNSEADVRDLCTRLLPRGIKIPNQIAIAHGNLRHLLIQIVNANDLIRISPSQRDLCSVGADINVQTICVFSLSCDGNAPVVRSRDFCAPIGTYEEPASGTTQAAIGSFLLTTRQLRIETMKRGYAAYQGVEMGSPSRLEVSIVDRKGKRLIAISGTARHVRKIINIKNGSLN